MTEILSHNTYLRDKTIDVDVDVEVYVKLPDNVVWSGGFYKTTFEDFVEGLAAQVLERLDLNFEA